MLISWTKSKLGQAMVTWTNHFGKEMELSGPDQTDQSWCLGAWESSTPTTDQEGKNFFKPSHVWMWELDYKESWAPKNWCFWTVVLEKTLESPLDCKEIQPVYPKGNQSWVFIGRTDAEAEAPILWPPDEKNWLIGKDPYAGQGWRQVEKGMTEDEMAGWHHQIDGHEFEQTLGVGDGQGSLACCSPWGHKNSDTTEWLNWMVILYQCFLCIKDCIPKLKKKSIYP